jgi:hypothetical protein
VGILLVRERHREFCHPCIRADLILPELETINLSLQNRLDIAERKIQVHETALRNITQERDSAVSQLGIAYLNSQDLKKENETLRQANAELKSQLAQLSYSLQNLRSREVDIRQIPDQTQSDVDATVGSEDGDDAQRCHNKRIIEPSQRVRDRSMKAGNRLPDSGISVQTNKKTLRTEDQPDDALFSLDLRQPNRSTMSKSAKSESSMKPDHPPGKKQPNTSRQRAKRVMVEDIDMSEPVEINADGVTQDGQIETSTDRDLTLLSLIDVSVMNEFYFQGHQLIVKYRAVKSPNSARRSKQRELPESSGKPCWRKTWLRLSRPVSLAW